MTTRGTADVVFCLDASASMRPCFDGVRTHLGDFLAGLKNNQQQMVWDLRFDFVAHSAGTTQSGVAFHLRSLFEPSLIPALYGAKQQGGAGRFFTDDVEQFRRGLQDVPVRGDEASLVALDCCLDFPWREARTCHRVVIFMTDERFETGVLQAEQRAKLADLQQKIQALKVMLYIVAPDSKAYSELAAVDRSEYETVGEQGTGLATVDFQEVLGYIGKSVSVSTLQSVGAAPVRRGLFGQSTWGITGESIAGQ